MKNKKCSKCHKVKPIVEFSLNRGRTDGHNAFCLLCGSIYGKENYRKHKGRYVAGARRRNADLNRLILERKNKPCMDCGVQYPPYVMDFDHRDGKEKIEKISSMRRRHMSFEKIKAEMDKCDLVCANCHRERTNTRNPANYNVNV